MSQIKPKPVALTIAGSDSGGGAGIQADLKTFAELGVHGACAITCITAQNPRAIFRLEPCPPKMVRAQLEAVFSWSPPAAAKTGLLCSAADYPRSGALLPANAGRSPGGGSGHGRQQRPAPPAARRRRNPPARACCRWPRW